MYRLFVTVMCLFGTIQTIHHLRNRPMDPFGNSKQACFFSPLAKVASSSNMCKSMNHESRFPDAHICPMCRIFPNTYHIIKWPSFVGKYSRHGASRICNEVHFVSLLWFCCAVMRLGFTVYIDTQTQVVSWHRCRRPRPKNLSVKISSTSGSTRFHIPARAHVHSKYNIWL